MTEYKSASVFRKDIVTGDWILVAANRRNRPGVNQFKNELRKSDPIENCPFEDPQKNNESVILWCAKPELGVAANSTNWFLLVLANKFPVLNSHNICPKENQEGIYRALDGVGFHEVIITRDHVLSIANMTNEEIGLVLRAYIERFISIKSEACVKYVLIFHNHGPKAGASITHPHSQLVALPIIPPDVARSLNGSRLYFEKNKTCVHCAIIDFEIKEKTRVIYENEDFIAFCPFASHVSFEVRIYPKKHEAHFENISPKMQITLSGILKNSLNKLQKAMSDPDYNFFIHTAPVKSDDMNYYHWHVEILPRTSIWAGVELGTGIEVIAVAPEEAAAALVNS